MLFLLLISAVFRFPQRPRVLLPCHNVPYPQVAVCTKYGCTKPFVPVPPARGVSEAKRYPQRVVGGLALEHRREVLPSLEKMSTLGSQTFDQAGFLDMVARWLSSITVAFVGATLCSERRRPQLVHWQSDDAMGERLPVSIRMVHVLDGSPAWQQFDIYPEA